MIEVHHKRRSNVGGLIKFRFSIRYSRLVGEWRIMEIWTSHHHFILKRDDS